MSDILTRRITVTKHIFLAAALLAALAASANADNLTVGDPAPKLAVKGFVKGDAVQDLAKGKIYVVEFWATWCGPCRATIPHLTELQKKHPEVTFIGVSVYEQDQEKVKPFVKEMGDKMDYRVAVDDVPEGGNRAEGKMAKSWMDAAAQDGIPTAFIINERGKIAWLGHPSEMDKPLDEILNGTWNLEAAAREYKKELAKKLKLRELQAAIAKARESEDPKAELAVLDKALREDESMEAMLGVRKFELLVKDSNPDPALAYGTHLFEKTLNNNPQGLNFFAWRIVDPDAKTKPDAKLVKLGLAAAKRADELAQSKDAPIADTLAAAYAADGDMTKAAAIQAKAVELAKGTPLEKDKSLQERLERYKKAAKK
jgi:thiol-disulfide isomerase/thioredoxin